MRIYLILFIFIFPLNSFAQDRWEKLNGPEGGDVTSLSVYGDTLLAGVGFNGKLYYSFDRGNSWKYSIKLDQSFTDLSISKDQNIVFNAGIRGVYTTSDLQTYTKLFANGQYFFSLIIDNTGTFFTGTTIGNIYSSSDNGVSWLLSINNGSGYCINSFAMLSDSSILAGTRGCLFLKEIGKNWKRIKLDTLSDYKVTTDKYDNIYAFSSGRMKLSTDKGMTWTNRDTSGFMLGNYMNQCIYNNRLICALNDETGWFGDGWGIAVSDDQGLTWKLSNRGLPAKISSFNLAKSGSDTYVGTNAAGVFKSTDLGESWFPVNDGIAAADTWVINFDKDGCLYAASWSSGVHKSTDKGLSWKVINNGFTDSYFMAVIPDTNGILFASSSMGGTYRSIDKGENWNKVDENFYMAFKRDKQNRIYGLGYGCGLYRTSDAGNNWSRIDNGFINGYVFGFAIDSSNNIYAGTRGGAIYKTTNDGLTWTKLYQSNITDGALSTIAIAPNGYIYATNIREGIIRSTNNGQTWTKKRTDTGWQDIYPINIDKKGVIYASGSGSKLYSSTNNGDTWVDIVDNLKLTSVRDIIFDKDGQMFLATDESVWRSNPLWTGNIKEEQPVISNYSLSQNYPNPFNPVTTIKYSIKDAGFVKLQIYDILGREIKTLVNEEKPVGEYEVKFNGSNLASGVYFYKLTAGPFTQIRKMQLLK